MDEFGLGIVAGEFVLAVAAVRRFVFDEFIGRKDRAFVFGVPRLSAAVFAQGRFGRGGFDVGCVGGGRLEELAEVWRSWASRSATRAVS